MQKIKGLLSVFLGLAILALPSLALASNGQGQKNGIEPKGNMGSAVQQIKNTVGQDQNLGELVRQIVREEASSTEQQARIIKQVESRNKIKTFLFGSDYKNLGQLRSSLASTTNNLRQLERAMMQASTTSSTPEIKAELTAQVSALQAAKLKIESFIKSNESNLSLFGWIVKLFAR